MYYQNCYNTILANIIFVYSCEFFMTNTPKYLNMEIIFYINNWNNQKPKELILNKISEIVLSFSK